MHTSEVLAVLELLFFFKQKTAYDVLAWLEFRRVLFPSSAAATARTPSSSSPRRRWPTPPPRPAGWSAPPSRRSPRTARPARRSEERRVGKECRSRWSADH